MDGEILPIRVRETGEVRIGDGMGVLGDVGSRRTESRSTSVHIHDSGGLGGDQINSGGHLEEGSSVASSWWVLFCQSAGKSIFLEPIAFW